MRKEGALKRSSAPVVAGIEPVTEKFSDGKDYVYLPLGKYVVAARGVCGGRPTLKWTRMDARHVISYLQIGDSLKELAERHKVPVAAIREVIKLQSVFDYEKSYI